MPGADARPAGLLAAALAADPARPAVTFYDGETGERVELSVATLDNWVAKTANLLQDGLGLDPGGRVVVDLPLHWLAPVWLLACWSAGATAVLGPAGDEPDLTVTGPDGLPAAASAGGEVVAVSLRPLGAPFLHPLPAGVSDYGREVLSYGDRFQPDAPPPPEAPALLVGGRAWSQRDLATVDPLGLGPGDRVLSTRAYDAWPAVHAGLLAPLRAGAGVVLVRHPDPDALPALVAQERVSAGVDAGVAGVRPLLAE